MKIIFSYSVEIKFPLINVYIMKIFIGAFMIYECCQRIYRTPLVVNRKPMECK